MSFAVCWTSEALENSLFIWMIPCRSSANTALSWFGSKVKESIATRVGSMNPSPPTHVSAPEGPAQDEPPPSSIPHHLTPLASIARPSLAGIAEVDEEELAATTVVNAAVSPSSGCPPSTALDSLLVSVPSSSNKQSQLPGNNADPNPFM